MRNLNGIAASTRSAALLGFILSPLENGGVLALVMTRPSLSLSLSLSLSIPSATLRSSSSSVLVNYELEGEIALPVAALQQDRESHAVAQIVGH